MTPTRKEDILFVVRLVFAIGILATPYILSRMISLGVVCLLVFAMGLLLLSLRIIHWRGLSFFLIFGAISYSIPLTLLLRPELSLFKGTFPKGGLVLSLDQVVGQLNTLPFFLSVTLAVNVLLSISLGMWLDVIFRVKQQFSRTAACCDFVENIIQAIAATSDYRNIVRSRISAANIVRASYHSSTGGRGSLVSRATRHLHDAVTYRAAKVELLAATGVDLVPTILISSVRFVERSHTAPASRYSVSTLLSLYQSYSMSKELDPTWQRLLSRSIRSSTKVADVGAGNGRLLPWLVSVGADVHAFEPDTTFWARLTEEVRGYSHVRFHPISFEEHATSNLFDVIVLMNNVLLEMIADSGPEIVFSALSKNLSRNGVVLFDYPDRAEFDETGTAHRRTFTQSDDFCGDLDITCLRNDADMVDAACRFTFDRSVDERTQRGQIRWLERVRWSNLQAINQAIARSGLRIKSVSDLEAKTVIPAKMYLFECTRED